MTGHCASSRRVSLMEPWYGCGHVYLNIPTVFISVPRIWVSAVETAQLGVRAVSYTHLTLPTSVYV